MVAESVEPKAIDPEPQELGELTKPSMLEEARKIVDDMKQANADRLKLIERDERLKAQEMLGGRSEAGAPPPEKKELTPKEYKDKVIAGEIRLSDEKEAKTA